MPINLLWSPETSPLRAGANFMHSVYPYVVKNVGGAQNVGVMVPGYYDSNPISGPIANPLYDFQVRASLLSV